ncbi:MULTISPECIES: ATP-binding protein [unclassified Actinopolyspora]|uniref:sensor histidine kinase n=1 Tax=unclassified Actinopolyspora TaxID=2639451 RepID=UPI0013F5B394|nr:MULTISPECIES: ATP-binding protein [unclassified Actinopolyspora]NHD17662.1 sensor histidine kinase [Actinopolyspora sp. BKK2]NHE76605.1 sensor histidine kinase [Actinopolyspora sp. BKK1]
MVSRVWEMLERSRKSLRDGAARQRLEGSTKQLLQRSRETVAQIIGPVSPREPGAQDVLAGVCSSVALRDLNLVDSLLEQLEQMESEEDDPESLDRLYRLDHLATRLRRNGENLRVLAGRDAGGTRPESASLVDVIRAGMSAIEHYSRVELGKVTELGIVGLAADDVSRLLAELLDNATTHSPPNSAVSVSAHLTERGSIMVRIEDSGIGLPAARLSALNERLASAPVLDRDAVRHMGLAVVRRLSGRHGIRVWLSRRAPHGTTASVLLPSTLVHEESLPEGRGPARRPMREKQLQEPVDGARNADAGPSKTPGRQASGVSPDEVNKRAVGSSVSAEPVWPSEEQAAVQQPGTEPSTTVNGLPRRVSQSLKGSSAARHDSPTPSTKDNLVDMRESHEQLLADLGAFAEGEDEARQNQQDDNDDAERSQQ